MITAEALAELKDRLRKMIAEEDFGLALRATLASVPSHSPLANTLCLMQGRLHDLRRDQARGIIDPAKANETTNRLRAELLAFIDDLSLNDYQPAIRSDALPPDKTGHLLYAIPPAMPLEQDTRCLVRLAFEKETLRRDLDPSTKVTLKPVRIAEVMDVALIDPNQEDTFRIRPLSCPEQFVERGDYSEWIFLVRPLRTGTYPLILRIAVIEIKLGKERRKEIVLEEEVRIVAGEMTPEQAPDPPLKTAAAFSTHPEEISGEAPTEPDSYDYYTPPVARRVDPKPAEPPAKPSEGPAARPSGPSSPSPAPARRRTLPRRWLAVAAGIALVVSVGLWIVGGLQAPESTAPAAPEKESPEKETPADIAAPALDSMGGRPDTTTLE